MSSQTDSRPRRALLVGLGPTAFSARESLLVRFEVVGLIREPGPAPSSEDGTVQLARSRGVTVYPDASLAGVDSVVSALDPDCVVVSSHNRVFPAPLLAKTRFVNVHYSPLPRYRGRANVNWALINGETHAAISIHTMVPGLDAGRILYQRHIRIQDRDTAAVLYEKLNDIQRAELAATVCRHLDGYEGLEQSEDEATYCCTRTPDDGEIDWCSSTKAIDRLIRALAPPFPGACTYHSGARLVLLRAEPVGGPRYEGRVPGRVVRVSKEGYVDVLTGDGVLRVFEVGNADMIPIPAAEVIRSVRDTLGLRTSDLLRRLEQLEQTLARLSRA